MAVLEQAKVNRELQRLGLGHLKDPNLIANMAYLVRDHAHFRGILMHMPMPDRKEAYDCLAPKLRFKAKSLEDYEIEARYLAEKNQLPQYNPSTLEAKEWGSRNVGREEVIQPKLERIAEESINRDLREEQAKIQNTLVCHKCTQVKQFRMKTRRTLFKIAAEAGWFIDNLQAFCPDCKPKLN
jgi:hypothetical protein